MHSPAGQIIERCRQAGLLFETQLHTSSWFLPRELFYKQPEYFRMNAAGERSPDANFCFMNDARLLLQTGSSNSTPAGRDGKVPLVYR